MDPSYEALGILRVVFARRILQAGVSGPAILAGLVYLRKCVKEIYT